MLEGTRIVMKGRRVLPSPRIFRGLVIELETKGHRNEMLAGLRAMTNLHLRKQVAERLGVSDVL